MLGTTTFKMMTREFHNQNDLKGVSLLKGVPGSITNQTTAREYDKSVFSGIITIKTVWSAANKSISRECQKQKDCQRV